MNSEALHTESDLTIGGEVGLDPSVDDDARLAFRNALGQFCTGVTTMTTIAPDGEQVGITASSFNSLSLDPPLILWSIADDTPSFDCFTVGDPFVVNVLAADQQPVAMKFAQSGPDKFASVKPNLACAVFLLSTVVSLIWNVRLKPGTLGATTTLLLDAFTGFSICAKRRCCSMGEHFIRSLANRAEIFSAKASARQKF
ncbi:MAG: flavin reductase family protein [Rhodospirillaceae bacterium]|nr:flavin reductase family protein [Rhodospirillaceae bacterium]